jgi:hypothetical protein
MSAPMRASEWSDGGAKERNSRLRSAGQRVSPAADGTAKHGGEPLDVGKSRVENASSALVGDLGLWFQ